MSEYSGLPPEAEGRQSFIYPDELFDQVWETPAAPVKDAAQTPGDYEYERKYKQLASGEELLTVEQERELRERIKAGQEAGRNLQEYEEDAPDASFWRLQTLAGKIARDKLVISNLRFAAWFVRETMDFRKQERLEEGELGHPGAIVKDLTKLSGGELNYDDRLQIATIGLIKAAERHDSERGRFTTYAMWQMEAELLRAMFDFQSPLTLTSSASQVLQKFRKKYREVEEQSIDRPEYEDLADVLNWDIEDTIRLNELMYAIQPISYEQIEEYWQVSRKDEAALTEETDAEVLDLTDILADPGVVYSVFDEAALVEMGLKLDDALSILSERDQIIVEQKTGLESGKKATYDEIALIFGVTRERIRQRYVKALTILQTHYSEKLVDFRINEDPTFGLRSQVPLTIEDDTALGLERAQKSRYPVYREESFFGSVSKNIYSGALERRAYSLDEFQAMRSKPQGR